MRTGSLTNGVERAVRVGTYPRHDGLDRWLGNRRPGPAQGEQFVSVAVELRPALSHVRASERTAFVL